MLKRRFPATIKRSDSNMSLNFLNDKKIDGELYGYLQSIANPIEISKDILEMRINKKNGMPTQTEICKKIGIKSTKTYRAHLNYLIERGFVREDGEEYVLDNKEQFYLMIPLETLQFLLDSVTENVIKIYVYLGEEWRKKKNKFEFTMPEIGRAIGIKVEGNERGRIAIRNALTTLEKLGLIDFTVFFDGIYQKMRLTKFSLERVKGKLK